MAIKDITNDKVFEGRLDYTFSSPVYYKPRVINFAETLELGTQFAHPLFNIEVGEAYVGTIIVVKTTLVGATATLTIQDSAGPTAHSTAIVGTTLLAGMQLELGVNVKAATGFDIVGIADTYAHTTLNTIDMDVNVADITAGELAIIGVFRKGVNALFNQ